MIRLQENGVNGILADEMGLGKVRLSTKQFQSLCSEMTESFHSHSKLRSVLVLALSNIDDAIHFHTCVHDGVQSGQWTTSHHCA